MIVTRMKKASLAAISALALVLAAAGTASAFGHGGGGHGGGGHAFMGGSHGFGGGRGFHGHGFGRGAAFGGLALGAFAAAPYAYGYDDGYYGAYAYDYGPDCYLVRRVVIDRWGDRVVRRVRV